MWVIKNLITDSIQSAHFFKQRIKVKIVVLQGRLWGCGIDKAQEL